MVGTLWWPPAISVPAGYEFTRSLGPIDDSCVGRSKSTRSSYGIDTEPPVWIGDEALIVRVNERDLVRIDVSTGERTTIVAGARFLPPADDYPGGFGFAYWQPTPYPTPTRRPRNWCAKHPIRWFHAPTSARERRRKGAGDGAGCDDGPITETPWSGGFRTRGRRAGR